MVNNIGVWFRAFRIKHWIKNFFVLAPFLVGPKFGFNTYLVKAFFAVLCFNFFSSSVYLFNDIVDIESDQEHPVKRNRPIASGQISIPIAIVVSILLAVFSLVAAFMVNSLFFLVLVTYGLNNILYSFFLKHKTVLDVMSIAFGFVLRAYGGGFAIELTITHWMAACVFSLALVLGFGKRRSEIEELKGHASNVRKTHKSYTPYKLNVLLAVSASITIVTYMLYCMAPETKTLHDTNYLIFTTPFVLYCIYRYMLKVQEEIGGVGPVELILSDKGFLTAGILWVLSLLFLFHVK
jgi:4-hydroxybenzoate polyprenyltransferase